MLERGKIGSLQAVLLMMSLVLPTAIITVPASTVAAAKQDAWLSCIVGTLLVLPLTWLIVNLSLRFPGKTLFEYPEVILGRVPGKIVSFLYLFTFLQSSSLAVRQFGLFLVTTMMPYTPIIVFSIVLVAVTSYAVRNGLEVLCRYNQLFIPVTGLLGVAFSLSVKDMKLTRLLPVFDVGLIPIVKGAFSPVAFIGLIFAMAVIIPYLSKPKEAYRVAYLSVLLNGFFLTVTVLESLLIFGPSMTSSMVYPTFNAIRTVSIANFLERLEAILLALWVLGGIAKLGVYYYILVLGSAQWLGLKDYRPLVTPVGIIMIAMSTLSFGINVVDLNYFLFSGYQFLSILVYYTGLPLLLLIVAMVRGKGVGRG